MIGRRLRAFLRDTIENKLLVTCVELLAGISVICTVVVMWAIYLGQRGDAQVLQQKQMAVEMLTLSHDEHIVGAKSAVTRFILSNMQQIREASRATAGQKPVAIVLDPASRDAFVAITEHYDEVLKCRESGECHASMIDVFYRSDICRFTEFAQLAAFPSLIDDFGPSFGDRLVQYKQAHCPRSPV